MAKPKPGTFNSHYDEYVNQVTEADIEQALAIREERIGNVFSSIAESRTEKGYAPGKWTLKDLLQHMIDCERIFCYRALCIARGEQKSLPGFDDGPYAQMAAANRRSWASLCEEFDAVRKTTKMLFDSFSDADMERSGLANNHPITVLALGYITLGHAYHHIRIVKERYLTAL